MLALLKFVTGATGLALAAGAIAPAAAQIPLGRFGSDSVGVDRCARAAEAQVSRGGYGNYRYSNYGPGDARVVAITRVEQRPSGLRVRGVVDARSLGRQYDFRCNVDYRGAIRDVDIHRRSSYYRG